MKYPLITTKQKSPQKVDKLKKRYIICMLLFMKGE